MPSGGNIVIGDFDVTVTGAPGSSVTLVSSSIGTINIGTVGADLATVFDPLPNDSARITIAAIPEPNPILMWGLMIGAIVGCVQTRKLVTASCRA